MFNNFIRFALLEIAEIFVFGKYSDKANDATSSAICPLGYHVKSCICNRRIKDNQPCDGSWVINNSNGRDCTVWNGVWGRGVQVRNVWGRGVYVCMYVWGRGVQLYTSMGTRCICMYVWGRGVQLCNSMGTRYTAIY